MKVVREGQPRLWELPGVDAGHASSRLGGIRLLSFPSQRLSFQICEIDMKIPSLRALVRTQ